MGIGLRLNEYQDRDRILASTQVRDGVAMSRSAYSTRVTRADPTDESGVAVPRALQQAETRALRFVRGTWGQKGRQRRISNECQGDRWLEIT